VRPSLWHGSSYCACTHSMGRGAQALEADAGMFLASMVPIGTSLLAPATQHRVQLTLQFLCGQQALHSSGAVWGAGLTVACGSVSLQAPACRTGAAM
jgi:hypothetical protein